MSIGTWRKVLSGAATVSLGAAVLVSSISPASAQNKKRSWEIFIYFGQYAGQTVPSAIQKGVVSTYRLDPFLATQADPNNLSICPICRNLGMTGPGQEFLVAPAPGASNQSPGPADPCPFNLGSNIPNPDALDPNTPYFDECDDDIEARYKYNTAGIVTNGQVQKNDREFLLGSRLGYNVTRHWEVELDLGFAKQRLDMTKNLIPLLRATVSNPADPWFDRLASFYEFTWSNRDFYYLGYQPFLNVSDPNIVDDIRGMKEIPNVPQHRFSRNIAADIPAVMPMPLAKSETFADVTDFVNRVFLNPQAFRNRANQININILSAGLTGVYNFNTKPDSRLVPYLEAGAGRWMRSFDSPYEGQDSDYLTYGGGVRFFVNEIFSFRAEVRGVLFRQGTATITGTLGRQNLLDNGGLGVCFRDQDPPTQQPPQECQQTALDRYFKGGQTPLPRGAGAGGRASIEIETATNDFYEARVGFDVLLGGK